MAAHSRCARRLHCTNTHCCVRVQRACMGAAKVEELQFQKPCAGCRAALVWGACPSLWRPLRLCPVLTVVTKRPVCAEVS